jgi:hypothetical protein
MPDTRQAIGEKVAFMCEPITIEEQGEGFHAVIASTPGQMFITNDVGKLVIELCDGLRTGEDIVAAVGDRYPGIPAGRVRKDVTRFLAAATGMGLVTWTG